MESLRFRLYEWSLSTALIGVSDDDALYFLSDRQADTKLVFPSPCIVNRGSKDQPIVVSNKKICRETNDMRALSYFRNYTFILPRDAFLVKPLVQT